MQKVISRISSFTRDCNFQVKVPKLVIVRKKGNLVKMGNRCILMQKLQTSCQFDNLWCLRFLSNPFLCHNMSQFNVINNLITVLERPYKLVMAQNWTWLKLMRHLNNYFNLHICMSFCVSKNIVFLILA